MEHVRYHGARVCDLAVRFLDRCSDIAAVVVGMVAYGFGSGAWISLVAASTGAISPTRDFGMRLGMLRYSRLASLLDRSFAEVRPLTRHRIEADRPLVLVSAADGKFRYAGIFCGLTSLLDPLVDISPRIWE